MNKKIIAIIILGIFLMTSISTVSAVETTISVTKIKHLNTNSEHFKLYVTLIDLLDRYIGNATVTVYNERTKQTYPLKEVKPNGGEYFVGNLPFVEDDRWTATAIYENYKISNSFMVYNYVPGLTYHVTLQIPKSRSVQPKFLIYFERFFEQLPIFQRLLNL